MIKSPCKDCPNRTIPKTCESSCELWKEYVQKRKEEEIKIRNGKAINRRVTQSIWRNYNK